VLLIAAAAAGSMGSGWIVICSVLPSIRLRKAAVVNLGSSAVANTLPAGGALAMGVSCAMLSGWGISTADYVLYSLVSGIWNVFARLSLPVLALLILLTAGRPDSDLLAAAATGLGLLAATGLPPCSSPVAGESPRPRWRATSPCGSSCWHACAAPACPRPKCPGRPPLPPSRLYGC
jgi:hypothetical protein